MWQVVPPPDDEGQPAVARVDIPPKLSPVIEPQKRKGPAVQGLPSGRYWARTSDLRLVEAALSQLS